jgi:hypothetical protein
MENAIQPEFSEFQKSGRSFPETRPSLRIIPGFIVGKNPMEVL